mmetsp:Transcript_40110/g.88068  ORF Transcript_40110/g.88068 Transcript_40110/m.88068 type:complete len:238 (-) Transcript_40110:916-1629(-)
MASMRRCPSFLAPASLVYQPDSRDAPFTLGPKALPAIHPILLGSLKCSLPLPRSADPRRPHPKEASRHRALALARRFARRPTRHLTRLSVCPRAALAREAGRRTEPLQRPARNVDQFQLRLLQALEQEQRHLRHVHTAPSRRRAALRLTAREPLRRFLLLAPHSPMLRSNITGPRIDSRRRRQQLELEQVFCRRAQPGLLALSAAVVAALPRPSPLSQSPESRGDACRRVGGVDDGA